VLYCLVEEEERREAELFSAAEWGEKLSGCQRNGMATSQARSHRALARLTWVL
jgi:hypothetical protein